MATQKRPVQDRRSTSRIATPAKCRFTYEGKEHQAFIRDISLRGLSILSQFMPPLNAEVCVNLETPPLNRPLTLTGKVLRRDFRCTERGQVNAFVVSFSQSSPEVVRSIYQLLKAG